jgi:ribokinase
MARVIVFGAVAADVVLRVPSLPGPGDQVQAEPLGWRLGGSSANVACGLAASGHAVELIGPVGSDAMAAALVSELERRGVVTRRCIRVDGVSPRALIVLDALGERTILVLSGRSVTVEPVPIDVLAAADDVACVYVETYERFPTAIADAFADALLVTTAPASDGRPWPADLILGSERQFPPEALAAPYEWALPLAGTRLQWVVVTRGARGADAYGPRGRHHVGARPTRQVDSTGAGDAFAAGLIAGLLAGQPIEEAMELGSAQGAAAVGVLQSVPPDWVESIDLA